MCAQTSILSLLLLCRNRQTANKQGKPEAEQGKHLNFWLLCTDRSQRVLK